MRRPAAVMPGPVSTRLPAIIEVERRQVQDADAPADFLGRVVPAAQQGIQTGSILRQGPPAFSRP